MRTEIWAHRGASLHAPENTLSAFEEAVRLGADGIELDVQRSSDNHLVVTHDASLERTAGVQSQVSQMTLQALKKLNMGIAKADSTVHAMPTLREVFQWLRPTALKVDVELKDPTDLNAAHPQTKPDNQVWHSLSGRSLSAVDLRSARRCFRDPSIFSESADPGPGDALS